MKVKRFKSVFQVEGMDDRTIKVKQYAHHYSIILEQFDDTEVVELEITKWEVESGLKITNSTIEDCIKYVEILCIQLGEPDDYNNPREWGLAGLRGCAPELFFFGIKKQYGRLIITDGSVFEIIDGWNAVHLGYRLYRDGWNVANKAQYEYIPEWYERHLDNPEASNCFEYEEMENGVIRITSKDYNKFRAEERREKIEIALAK